MSGVTGQSAPGPDRLIADPEWLPHSFDAAGQAIGFVHVPREAHRSATFLDDKYLRKEGDVAVERLGVQAVRERPGPQHDVHFIFHSAFCCSTLLARAFDIPGVAMGLKEPAILNQLAASARTGGGGWKDALAPVLALLARPFSSGERIIVKPSNEANILIDPIMAARPQARALLLYSPLPDFLRSVAKRGMWGRIWGRRLFSLLRAEGSGEFGFSPAETFQQTDLQIAALAWLMHHGQFAELVHRMPGRVRVLSSEAFLAARTESLAAAAGFFGVDLPADRADQIVAGEAFAQHSKELGRRYDAAERKAEQAVAGAHDEEIAMVCKWAEAVAAHVRIPMELGADLLPAAKG